MKKENNKHRTKITFTKAYKMEFIVWPDLSIISDSAAVVEMFCFDFGSKKSKVAEIASCPVIISGGVSSIDDIKKAKNLKNVEGIIVGKAIYDGDIKLEELVKEDA